MRKFKFTILTKNIYSSSLIKIFYIIRKILIAESNASVKWGHINHLDVDIFGHGIEDDREMP